MKKVGSAFLTHREGSAQEAVHRLLSLQMKQLSRSVVFVDTNPKNERIAVLKDKNALDQLDDEDTKRALLTDTSIDQGRFSPHA